MAKVYKRQKYISKLTDLLQKEKLVLIYGTRQVGKTTLMKYFIENNILQWDCKYYSFEDSFDKRDFKDKKDFLDFLWFTQNIDLTKDWYLFIDEIQYIRDIDSILKSLYDDDSVKTKIIASGSGMWNISTKAWSSLVGRWWEFRIDTLDFQEFLERKWINSSFLTLEKYNSSLQSEIGRYWQEFLTYWWYPSVVLAKTNEQKVEELQKIVRRFFEKDITFRIGNENYVSFEKFFYFLIQNIWNIVKKENLANQLWISVYNINKYLEFLYKSLYIIQVRSRNINKSKEPTIHPKIYFHDMGILSFLQKDYGDKSHDGKYIENISFSELYKNLWNSEDTIKTYKNTNNSEIDFIYERFDGSIIPIEIKSNNNLIVPRIFHSFQKDFDTRIDKFARTTTNISKISKIWDKKILFIPVFMIKESILR